MKKYTIISLLIFCISVQAQKYLRYDMADGSFNGFYTESVDSILHYEEGGVKSTIVYASGIAHTIPIADIKGISLENAIPTLNDHGDYRLYEFNGDSNQGEKIFVDNRASLCASKNGDFGSNDTIVFSSAYNDIALLMTTDSEGRLKKIFSKDILIFFDYDDEHCTNAIIQDGKDYSVIPINIENSAKLATRAPGVSALIKVANFFRKNKQLSDFFIKQRGKLPDFVEFGISQKLNDLTSFFVAVTEMESNPEMRNQCLIVDALSIAGDIAGIISSLAAEPASGGISTAILWASYASLLKDLTSMYNHSHPDDEQIRVYHDYYKNKYELNIVTLPATDITKTSATLNGSITSLKLLAGNLYFNVEQQSKTYSAQKTPMSESEWSLSAELQDLEPGKKYSFEAGYTIKVDGLDLVFTGGKQSFVSRSDISDITGVWLCKEYQEGELVGEATFELKEDKTVTKYDESGSGSEPGINTGYWSVNDDGTLGIEFSKSTFSGAHWKSYAGTFDDLSNPTKIEGKAYYQYTGNMGLGSQRSYDFIMTR